MTASNPTRRTLLIGAAWAAPVVVLASAAPLVAASGGQTLYTHGDVTRSNGNPYDIIIDSSSTTTPNATAGYWIIGTQGGQSITDATITLWYPETGRTFSNHSNGEWGNMAQVSGLSKPGEGGLTYYAYRATYSVAYAAISPSTSLPFYRFIAPSRVVPHPTYFYISASATYGTTQLTYDGGPFSN